MDKSRDERGYPSVCDLRCHWPEIKFNGMMVVGCAVSGECVNEYVVIYGGLRRECVRDKDDYTEEDKVVQ